MGHYHVVARPRAIDRIADDVEEMGLAARKAGHYAEDHLTIEIASGFYANLSKNHLDEIWLETRSDYEDAAKSLNGGARALRASARAYRQAEADQRRRTDRMLEAGNDWDSDAETDWDARPGISQSDVDGVLSEPGDAYRESWVDAFREMDEWVEKITSLGIQVEEKKIFGIENPAAGWADDWEGDWKKFGVAVAAVDVLGEFWPRLGAEARATLTRWEGTWSGNAADTAYAWFERSADEMIEHGHVMADNAGELFSSVLAVNEVMGPVFDFLGDLFDLLATITQLATEMDVDISIKDPLGSLGSIADLFGDKAKQLADLISKAGEVVGNVSKAINAVRAAGSFLTAVFQDLTTDSDLSLYTPPLAQESLGA